jgi:predicted O-methyltransferase YrrM
MIKTQLSQVLGLPEEGLSSLMEEAERIDEEVKVRMGRRIPLALDEEKRPFLYAVVKTLDPKVAVETGVGPGVSTTFILSALRTGKLYSIDLGRTYEGEWGGYQVGFVVPDRLKPKWKLILGDSKKLLAPLLEELGEIQFFLHDGEHTYDNVMFELTQAWNHMKRGVIMVDNFEFNEGTMDFCKRIGIRPLILSKRAGGFAMIPKL